MPLHEMRGNGCRLFCSRGMITKHGVLCSRPIPDVSVGIGCRLLCSTGMVTSCASDTESTQAWFLQCVATFGQACLYLYLATTLSRHGPVGCMVILSHSSRNSMSRCIRLSIQLKKVTFLGKRCADTASTCGSVRISENVARCSCCHVARKSTTDSRKSWSEMGASGSSSAPKNASCELGIRNDGTLATRTWMSNCLPVLVFSARITRTRYWHSALLRQARARHRPITLSRSSLLPSCMCSVACGPKGGVPFVIPVVDGGGNMILDNSANRNSPVCSAAVSRNCSSSEPSAMVADSSAIRRMFAQMGFGRAA